MRAVRIHRPGGVEELRYEEVPRPAVGPGQALVRIEAAGVNFIDVYHRSGAYKTALPWTLGLEAAGTVIELGPGADHVHVGDTVASANVPGAYAEYAVAPSERLVVLPEGVTARQGAAAMLQGMTAHYLALSVHPLKNGDTCLVHAAAGGVGLLLCQVARMRGARVIGTVSSELKADLARAAGAHEVIRYDQQDFVAEIARLTGGKGVNVVYDSVGKDTFARGLDCLAPRGTMVLFGQSSGAVAAFDPQLLNQKGALFLTRPSLFHYAATRAELVERAGEVLRWVRDGELRLRIEREFALKDAAEAHRALEGRKTTGKLLLIP